MAWEYIELNICPTGDKPVFHAAQYDIGRPIIIKLKNGEDDFTPTDLDIELQVRKVDNNVVTAVPDSVDGNVVTFLTTEQMTACSGTNLCEVQLTSGDNTMATLHFYLVVQRDALQGGLSSQSEIHDLEDQIAAIVPEVIGDEYYTAAQVDELIDDIPTFDPSNYYDKTQLYTKTETNGLLAQKANVSSLATVATTGNYNDLSNKPTIPDVSNYYTKSETYSQGEVDTLLATKADAADLATVATTGDYDDLLNKPSIPAAQVQSDWSQSDNTQVDYIKNKPTIPAAQIQSDWSQADNTQVDYIKNKPTIPGYATDLPVSSTDPTDTKSYIDTGLSGKADKTTVGTFTPKDSTVIPNNISFGCVDKLVGISARITGNLTANALTNLGTIDIKPNTDLYLPAVSGGGVFLGFVQITSAGSVGVYSTTGGTQGVCFSASYMAT